jgi:YegS/Rv2252/BmrU family lipid kinase
VSRVAVVVNPIKVGDLALFKKNVSAALASRGWDEPMWLETTPADPGHGLANEAIQANVDLVIAAGGDGTVTACAAGLAGQPVPLAILPIGTGNLLAVNLGVPTELSQAIDVAVTGIDRKIDLGVANGRPFVAMAGLGLDANMLASTSESAKKRFGYAAYVIAMLRHLRDRPLRVAVRTDGGTPRKYSVTGIVVGNVGWLHRGIRLLPDASPDDGLLDVAVLTASGLTGSIILGLRILLRRDGPRLVRGSFRSLRIRVDREQLWEIDGEVAGSTRELRVRLHAEKLVLRVPAEPC